MKKLLSCNEVGCNDFCDYIVTGESEEQVMINVTDHGMKKHCKTQHDMLEMREKIKEFIYTV